MKKIIRALLLITVLLAISALCGCRSQEDLIIKNARFENDSEYMQCDSIKDDLDSDGYYKYSSEETIPIDGEHKGDVYVTFAKNAYLDFDYYTDSKMNDETKIKSDACYLKPGSTIYAKINKTSNPNSNVYTFSKFIIREFSQDGKIGDTIAESDKKNKLVYSIPTSYSGKSIAVIPLGEYNKRQIEFKAYYRNSKDRITPLDLVDWIISDDENVYRNGKVEINPVSSYTVKCDYSQLADNYYFKDSSPNYFHHDEDSHIIEFYQKSSVDKSQSYLVQLHEFITLKILNSKNFFENIWNKVNNAEAIKAIKINQEEEKTIGALKDFFVNLDDIEVSHQLREGDTVTITVDENYRLKSKSSEIVIPAETHIPDGYKYTIVIPKDTNQISFDLYIEKRG